MHPSFAPQVKYNKKPWYWEGVLAYIYIYIHIKAGLGSFWLTLVDLLTICLKKEASFFAERAPDPLRFGRPYTACWTGLLLSRRGRALVKGSPGQAQRSHAPW